MAVSSTQITVSTVYQRILGPGATAFNNAGASAARPVHFKVQNFGTTRAFISPSSAGTTNNSYVVTALNVVNVEIRTAEDWWFFTSAGAATRMCFLGGLQT